MRPFARLKRPAFSYDRASRLVRIVDALERAYDLEYDDGGHLVAVSDFDGRTVRYEYDAEGRLSRVTSPAIAIGQSTFPEGLATEYEYAESPPAMESAFTKSTTFRYSGNSVRARVVFPAPFGPPMI